MSNSQVGAVYQQIIDEVIKASGVDFEEGGVDEAVLGELQMGWQKKLTQQQLAVFPWDPRPEPVPTTTAAAPASLTSGPSTSPVATNGNGYIQSQQAPAAQSMSMAPNDSRIKTEPAVKIEPGLEGSQMPQPMQGGGDHSIAQQRAIAQLHNQYGARATASITKVKEQPGGGAQPQNQQRSVNTMPPQGYPAQFQNPPQQQYRPNVPHNPGAVQQPQQRLPINGPRPANSQLDGAEENDAHVGILLHQASDGQSTEMGRVEIDKLLLAQITANAKAMEGGGFMMPLKRATRDRKADRFGRSGPVQAGPSQYDGPDDGVKPEDDDVSDEDAINSDLDDPEDNNEGDDDDDDAGQIMLCMYDKVQRVKNKWKCVLKDGVLNVNGKDYVFHKATGEYEW